VPLVPHGSGGISFFDVPVKEHADLDEVSSTAHDAHVLYEVLSRVNMPADQASQLKVCVCVPNCAHDVTAAQTSDHLTRSDRATAWAPVAVKGLKARLALPALGDVALPRAEIYHWTRVGKRA
jgi:hypothetical protein